MPTTVTCSKKSVTTRNARPTSKRRRSGTSLYRLSGACELSTCGAFCTGIWRAQTCSCSKTCRRSLAILTSRKLWRRAWATRRQALRTTRVLRSGATSRTTARAIFGHSAASCTRCAPWSRRSGPMTCRAFTKKSLRESFPGSLTTSVKRWPQSSSLCFRYSQATGHRATRF